MPCEPKRGNRTLQQKENRSKSQSHSRGPHGGGHKKHNTDNDYPSSGWSNEPSTSSALTKRADAERAQKLLPCIIYNDLIMRTIISNLPNFQDRINLERTSRYFNKISSSAPWKFNKLRNHLNLTYYALDTNITLEHGNLKFKRPSMTLVGRRERADARTSQYNTFLAALKGIARRFGKSIKFLTIGGTDEIARSFGIGDHQLIVTADLMDVILKEYRHVETLTFRNCGFDKDAVNYINDFEGPIFPKLKHLGLISVWCDGDAPPYMLMRIIPSGLLTLKAEYLKIDRNVGEALMGALENAEMMLKKVEVTIAHYFRVQSIDVQRFLRSLSRCTEQIDVHLVGWDSRDREPSSPLIAAFQISVELPNLTGLSVGHFPLNRTENYDYGEAVRSLRHGNRLINLSLNGWRDPIIIQSLTTSLIGAFLLESIALRDLPVETEPEDLTRLFEVLKVVHIELNRIPSMNSSHLRTICKKMPNLESLQLSEVPKVSSHSVEQCLKKWPKLECFDIENIPLSSNGIDIICNKNYLPNLSRACFWMIVDQQKRSSMEKLLQNFENVDCMTGSAPDRFCRVSVRNRRSTPLASISDAAVTYCHCDHNPRYHEPMPPRERWESSIAPIDKWWLRGPPGKKS